MNMCGVKGMDFRGAGGTESGRNQMLTCAWCGATAENTPLSWTLEITHGRSRYMCDRCSRENLAAIEGRLEADPY
jgi:hypothetical protein